MDKKSGFAVWNGELRSGSLFLYFFRQKGKFVGKLNDVFIPFCDGFERYGMPCCGLPI